MVLGGGSCLGSPDPSAHCGEEIPPLACGSLRNDNQVAPLQCASFVQDRPVRARAGAWMQDIIVLPSWTAAASRGMTMRLPLPGRL